MTLKLASLRFFLVVSILCTSALHAEPFPSRPIHIIVPAAAGSPLDINARKVGDKLSQALGQPVVIDNKPGANGIIGTDVVARAKPDGYTVLLGSTSTLSINPSLYTSLPYRPLEDFAPVTLAVRGSPLLLVNADLPVKSLADFVALAKAKPGQLHFGSPGNGSIQHLAGKLLERIAGIELVHVPYKNHPEIINDVIGGRIEAAIEFGAAVVPLVKAGKLRALAVAGPARKPDLPDVPTARQVGVPGFEVIGWNGYLVPSGTPPAVIEKLDQAIRAALTAPDFSNWVESLGSEVVAAPPQGLAQVIRSDLAAWRVVIKHAGLRLE